MIIFAIIAILASLIVLCRLCFSVAIYALPVLLGIYAAHWAWDAHTGWVMAGLIGLVAGVAALVAGNLALIFGRHPVIWATVALTFMTPAAIAGYYLVYGLMSTLHQPKWSSIVIGVLGGAITGITAIYRVATLSNTAANSVQIAA